MRQHWSLDPEVVFLNHGAFGACPTAVMQAAARVRDELEREPVLFFSRLEGALDAARREVSAFVGAAPDDLAFVNNTTAGVNAVLRSLDLGPGDKLLTTDHAYNACRNALEYVAERSGARVVVVSIPVPIRHADDVLERIVGAVDQHVKLALVDHVTSPTGLVLPVERIVAALRERGVETLVDGAHAPGMLPLAIEALGAGYYVGNFHKWLCAPKGAAMLWVRRDLQRTVHPTVISHGYTSKRDRSRFLDEFDWTGSDDPSAWLCVPAAIRFVGGLLPGGWPEIYARNRELAIAARRRLLEVLGTAPIAPESMLGSLAAVQIADGAPGEAPPPPDEPLHLRLFDAHRIEVPVFTWPAPPRRLLRVSAHLYNTLEDYQRLAAALRDELGRA